MPVLSVVASGETCRHAASAVLLDSGLQPPRRFPDNHRAWYWLEGASGSKEVKEEVKGQALLLDSRSLPCDSTEPESLA